jgi:hypothetical protein
MFLRSLALTSLLIFDDWIRDTLILANPREIIEMLDDRFSRIAILITAQMPVAEWLYLKP